MPITQTCNHRHRSAIAEHDSVQRSHWTLEKATKGRGSCRGVCWLPNAPKTIVLSALQTFWARDWCAQKILLWVRQLARQGSHSSNHLLRQ